MIKTSMSALPNLDDPIWYQQERAKTYRQLFELGKHDIISDGKLFCYIYDYTSCKEILSDHSRFAAEGERVMLSVTEGDGDFPNNLLSFRGDPQARTIRQDLRRALDATTSLSESINNVNWLIRSLTKSSDITTRINGYDLSLELSLEFMSGILGVPEGLQGLYTAWALKPKEPGIDALLMKKLGAYIESGRCRGVAKDLQELGWESRSIAFAVKWLSHASLRTLQRSITNLLYAIVSEPDLIPNSREDQIDSCILEVLRFYPPTVALARTAKRDCELESGISIREGTHVIAMVGAAQQDPTRFIHPDQFDCNRGAQDVLAFGWGSHSCLGETLARTLLKEILGYVRRNNLNLRLLDRPTPMRSFSFATWTNLPLGMGA